MKAYKAFDKDLSCTSFGNHFQYQLGVWNEEPEAHCVRCGFHCAENPLDCLRYYPNWDNSRYFEVEASGDIDEDNTDSKISCTRMRLVRELNIIDFIKEAVIYIKKYPTRKYGCQSSKIQAVNNFGKAPANGGLIVRGRHPSAEASKGAVIALLREYEDGSIAAAVMFRGVDGQRYKFDDSDQIVRCSV